MVVQLPHKCQRAEAPVKHVGRHLNVILIITQRIQCAQKTCGYACHRMWRINGSMLQRIGKPNGGLA